MANQLCPLFNYKGYIPLELVGIIKSYIPISILKTLRKLKPHELPKNYILSKALHEHFYMTSIGYSLNANMCNIRIISLEKQIQQINIAFNNSFKINHCVDISTQKIAISQDLDVTKNCKDIYDFLFKLYDDYYQTSSEQLNSYKIIEYE